MTRKRKVYIKMMVNGFTFKLNKTAIRICSGKWIVYNVDAENEYIFLKRYKKEHHIMRISFEQFLSKVNLQKLNKEVVK